MHARLPSSSPRLLILGGSRYNILGITEAREAGFRTTVVDGDPAAPGLAVADLGLPIDIRDVPALERLLQDEPVDGVVATAEVGVRCAAHLAHRFELPGIAPEAAWKATSKLAMRRAWADVSGISCPFYEVRGVGDLRRAARALGYPFLVKPDRSGGGSRGVRVVEEEDDLHQVLRHVRSGGVSADWMLPVGGPRTCARKGSVLAVAEALVYGSEHSAEALIRDGRVTLVCTSQRVKSNPPFRVDTAISYPATLDPQQASAVESMSQAAVEALGLDRGVAHLEFFVTQSGPMMTELGARCGGGHIPQIAQRVSGINPWIEACRMACGLEAGDVRPVPGSAAEYRFLSFPPGVVAGVEVPERWLGHAGVLDLAVMLAPGDEVRPLRSSRDRCGFLVTLGESVGAARRLADEISISIEVIYADGARRHALVPETTW